MQHHLNLMYPYAITPVNSLC